jgi:hypothetical protein
MCTRHSGCSGRRSRHVTKVERSSADDNAIERCGNRIGGVQPFKIEENILIIVVNILKTITSFLAKIITPCYGLYYKDFTIWNRLN